MSISNELWFANPGAGYEIDYSMRLNDDDKAYLTRTFSLGDRKKWTFSIWFKLCEIPGAVSSEHLIFHQGNTHFRIEANGDTRFYEYSGSVIWEFKTKMLFRDPAAWYHWVIAYDTAQATASDRFKHYVNGSLITDFAVASYPAQNRESNINSAADHFIGIDNAGSPGRTDAYFSAINFINAQALDATSFGEFNSVTGQWVPIEYAGAYGGTSFHLDFADSSDLGNDVSSISSGNLYAEGVNIGNMSTGGGLTAAFANNLIDRDANTGCSRINSASVGYTGKDWGSGVTRSINYVKLYSSDQGWTAGGFSAGTVTFVLQGSSDNFSSDVNDLESTTDSESQVSLTVSFTPGDTTAYRYHRIKVTGPSNGDFVLAEVIFSETGATDVSNSWTSSGLATNDQVIDTPTNNHCVLNAIDKRSGLTLTEGNLVATSTVAQANSVRGTHLITSGKWYWEAKLTDISSAVDWVQVGIFPPTIGLTFGSVGNPFTTQEHSWAFRQMGTKANDGSYTSYGSSWSVNDVIGVAFDADTGTLWFSINGTWQNSASLSEVVAGTTTNAAFTAIPMPLAGFCPMFSLDQSGSDTSALTIDFGQHGFAYTQPSGYLALSTANLPDPTIKDPSTHFQATLYTGNATAGRAITQDGNSQFGPDMVWIKNRDQADEWKALDTTRGATKELNLDSSNAESTDANGLTAFSGSDGFTLGTGAGGYNDNGEDFVAYQWEKGVTPGFDIVSFTAPSGTTAFSTAHNLGVTPNLFIQKAVNASNSWIVWADKLPDPDNDYIVLNTNAAQLNLPAGTWGGANTSSVFYNRTGNSVTSSESYITYLFAAVEGFSAFGSYVGNGSVDGPMINLGFKPALLITKKTSGLGSWQSHTVETLPANIAAPNQLYVGRTDAEVTTSSQAKDLLSNGFKIRTTDGGLNTSGGSYIYMAWAENPFKTATAR